MNWQTIQSIENIDDIIKDSFSSTQLIFKHSTRCSISSMAKNRLEKYWDFKDTEIKPHYLDLLNYRSISNQIADRFNVEHESPQIIIIKNGVCFYSSSHTEINVNDIKEHIK